MCWELRTLCLHADICVFICIATVYYTRFVDTEKKYVVEMNTPLLFNALLFKNKLLLLKKYIIVLYYLIADAHKFSVFDTVHS